MDDITYLVQRLRPKERRGSKPRCHFLTHGSADEVASRLTSLAAPYAVVSSDDHWMPQGFDDLEEAQLHCSPRLLNPAQCEELEAWWLSPASRRAKTPNFDIASTCTINSTPGLLLVEAKAHDIELIKEAAGRTIKPDSSEDRKNSHQRIGAAIKSARTGLEKVTSMPWSISRDHHYQMSNRFAWAWKLTELGIPVVLVYLGFLEATEMSDGGRKPFADHAEWEQIVKSHSGFLFSPRIWGQRWEVNERAFIPLIKSQKVPLN